MSRIRVCVRALLAAVLVAGSIGPAYAQSAAKAGTQRIDDVLRKAVENNGLPGVVAMVATSEGVVYQGAFGKQIAGQGVPMASDSIFRIASMTKAITSVAVMQLVERGRVKLDEPAGTYVPELLRVEVLEAFDAQSGKATLRAPKSRVTVRQLLSHTSGFGYEFFNPELNRYAAAGHVPSAMRGDDGFLKAPLVFDPGTKFEYGISTDWLGRLVETVSGQTLDAYFRQHIFEPLGMTDTFFNVPADKQGRVVTIHNRKDDGSLAEGPPQPMKPVTFFSGGGGLSSTASDYLKFTRMLLGGGQLGQKRVLRAETVKLMGQNQIGDFPVRFRSLAPRFARDGVQIPGSLEKFGLGFGINIRPVEGGRASGSMAWAGIFNTFFWIDPARKKCAVIMMQMLPFLDDVPKATLEEFERAVYAPAANRVAGAYGRGTRTVTLDTAKKP